MKQHTNPAHAAGQANEREDHMPRAPRKCSWSNCENRIANTRYCAEHTVHGWTGQSHTSDARHQTWRKAVLKRDKGMCQIKDTGCTHRATEADHILNVKSGGTYDLENGQAACSPCHKKKTQRESIEAQKKIRRKVDPKG